MKPWHFIGITVVLLGVAILGLRYNNITAYNMRDRLMSEDARGEDVREEVETELRDFVFSHMNASLNIVLNGQYTRDTESAQIDADQSIDSSIYDEAAQSCDREGQLTTENAQCVQDYVQERIDGDFEVDLPSREAYSYTFHSPAWTYDVPGLALLGAALSALMSLGLYLRKQLRDSKKY